MEVDVRLDKRVEKQSDNVTDYRGCEMLVRMVRSSANGNRKMKLRLII